MYDCLHLRNMEAKIVVFHSYKEDYFFSQDKSIIGDCSSSICKELMIFITVLFFGIAVSIFITFFPFRILTEDNRH